MALETIAKTAQKTAAVIGTAIFDELGCVTDLRGGKLWRQKTVQASVALEVVVVCLTPISQPALMSDKCLIVINYYRPELFG
ncbi:unnamed protein product [Danaus chrysippus]|uniref:(African queen) hypothetical protein n=1 Tax=Danaus chrysippus TaxID=151541 RepID=A0A8J2QBI6_9NEOP|nr:unnamed protein product [Danaus chrysippus]